jgi:hypothetical protein
MKKFSYKRVLITLIVVIIGISGIGWSTWHLGELFVGLVTTNIISEQEKGTNTNSDILNLPALEVWTCQAGVYKNKKNAELFQESLRLQNLKAELINEKPLTLAIGIYDTKEKAILQSYALAEAGIETWVREESFPALSYKVNGKNVKEIIVILEVANSLLSGEELNAVKAGWGNDLSLIPKAGYPEDLEKLYNKLSLVLNTDYKGNGRDCYHRDLLGVYLEYKSITTKYLKNYE